MHLELERADGRWRDLYPHASAEDEERIAAFVADLGGVAAARPRGRAGRRPHEVAFAFDVDGVLFRGRSTCSAGFGDGTALIVDFKTNRLGERVAQEVMDTAYGEQVTTYALAALRSGAPAAEIAYAFLEDAEAVAVRRFTRRGRAPPRGRAADRDRRDPGRPLPGPARARTAATARRSTCSAPGRALEWEG